MKKLMYLSVAVAALAAPAMADPDTITSVLDLPSPDNAASIVQIGSGNDALVNQRVDGLLNGRNGAVIVQDGEFNTARVRQSSVTSSVSGAFNNSAEVFQYGNEGTVRVVQIHDFGSEAGLIARVEQFADEATVRLRQRGDGNEALVTQRDSAEGSLAGIQQNGFANTIELTQAGADSEVFIRQGRFSDSDAVSPDTTDNAAAFARADIVTRGDGASITLRQIGFDNVARIRENGEGNTANVSMTGDFNKANIGQRGINGLMDIAQTGFLNRAIITQTVSSSDDEVFLVQAGDMARAEITQSDDYSLGGGNLAQVDQFGFAMRNKDILAVVEQNGSDNVAKVVQYADYAVSLISQTGMAHTAVVAQ